MYSLRAVIVVVFLATANCLYDSSDNVVELTPDNFNRDVINGDDLWVVEFYAPWCGHCQSLAPEWKKAAKALKGVVKVGAVDMDQHPSLGSPYNVRGFPTIKVFGANKNSPQDYNGARSANSIVDTALSHLQAMVKSRLSGGGGSGGSGGGGKCGGGGGGQQKQKCGGGGGGGSRGGSGGGGGSGGADVVTLTDANFEEQVLNSKDFWLVEFYAPWCGHCKSLEPEWAKAASELKGKVKLGALDATVHTVMASRYGVQGYPTIKSFPAGKKDGNAAEYDGGRTADDIVQWALDKHGESIPEPELVELTSGDVLSAACESQLCILAILPHILDCQSACRQAYLKTMKELAAKYKKHQWGWVWAEAGAQAKVEEAFELGGFGYPAMVTVNARKMKFAMLKGPFSYDGINEFLRALSMGRGSTAPVRGAKLPEVKTRDAWDGKDGKMPEEPSLEDLDLSDVTLDPLPSKKKTEL